MIKITNVYFILFITVIIVVGVSVALLNLKVHHINQFLSNLSTVNEKVSFELQRQTDNMILDAKDLLSERHELALILQVLNTDSDNMDKNVRFELRKMLSRELFPLHYKGFYLISRNKQIVAAMKDTDLGATIPAVPLSIISRLDFGEKAIVSHPFMFKDKLGMWIVHTVQDFDGKNVGYLAIVAGNPHRFSVTTAVTGIGYRTTETYLTDANGFMLSESRFIDELVQMGLLNKGEKSTLRVRVSNPGLSLLDTKLKPSQDVVLPFTYAVERVLNDKTAGISNKPYRNYRGAMVMGSWQWNKRLNAAIITETDESEVMEGYYFNLKIVLSLLLLLMLGSLVFTIAYSRLRIRTEREANRHRNLLLESTAEAIFGINVETNFTFVNRSFLKLLGYTEVEIIGKAPCQFIKNANDEWCNQDNCQIYIANNQQKPIHTKDEYFVHKNGRSIPVEYWSHPLLEGGKSVGSVITILDMTAQFQAESERAKIEKQLQHTQRLESLGVLAGGIAHDFNNLLTAIMGNAFLVESNIIKDPLKAKERASTIILAAEKAAVLCKQMLAYSGRGQFILKHINLSALVTDMMYLMDVSIEKSVVIKYHLTDSLPSISGDEAQVQQIVLNLITNANDAIGSKSGVISITTGVMQADESYLLDCYGNLPEEGRFVYIEVSDTGCGMDKETIEKIFDPFFTTKLTGHGLGMSAVLGIIRGHKGALKVYSERGKGTTFKLLLPAKELSKEQLENEDQASLIQHNSNGKVLVVDDEETVREMACIMLEDMGFSTVAVADGIEALACYKQNQESIIFILTDLTMPRMGGKELLSELLKINPACRVILTSGYNSQDSVQQFSGKNLSGFVQKPFTPIALSNEIKKLLGDDT